MNAMLTRRRKMTAREILTHFQILDADREWVGGGDKCETQAQVLARKLEEANDTECRLGCHGAQDDCWARYDDDDDDDGCQCPCHNSNDDGEGGSFARTLVEEVKEAWITSPVWLQRGGCRGRDGKPQILGGHHRVAVAMSVDPDRPIPVRWAEDISDARSSGEYT